MSNNFLAILLFFTIFSYSQKNRVSIVHTGTVSNNKISYIVGKIYVIPKPVEKKKEKFDEKKYNIRLYPNPVTNSLSFETDDKSLLKQITIYGIEGKLIYTNKLENNTLDLSFLKQGVYIIELDNDKSKAYKIIKN